MHNILDVIDWIMENLIDQTRTRRGIIIKLKELGLIFKAPTKKSNVRERIPKEFGEDEDELLRKLWNTYGETNGKKQKMLNNNIIYTLLINM